MLEGSTLSSICVHEHTVELQFESHFFVTAYSKLSFIGQEGILSAEDVAIGDVCVGREFLGSGVTQFLVAEGKVEISFEEGRQIILERIGNEPEIGLISFPEGVRVLS